jgi:hypothetical protein
MWSSLLAALSSMLVNNLPFQINQYIRAPHT